MYTYCIFVWNTPTFNRYVYVGKSAAEIVGHVVNHLDFFFFFTEVVKPMRETR